jgi:hypothetical protein
MALNTGIESLDAGAPELRLEGKQQAGGVYQQGSDVKNALAVWTNMGPEDRAGFDGFLDFFRSGAWRDQIQGMRSQERDRRFASHEGNDAFLEQRYEYYLEQGFSPRKAAEQAKHDLESGNFDPGNMAHGGIAGTYTQRRRNQMAYGGTPGADGRRAYGIGSFIQEKIKDPIKEKFVDPAIDWVTENPMLTAAGLGIGANYLDMIPGQASSQGWINDLFTGGQKLIGKGITGAKNIMGIGGPDYSGVTGVYPPGMMGGTQMSDFPFLGETGFQLPSPDADKSLIQQFGGWVRDQATGAIRNVLTGQSGSQQTTGKQNINWQTPVAAGMTIGALDAAMRKKESIPQGLGLDVGGTQRLARITPEAEAAKKGLFFTPQDKYRLHQPIDEQAILGAAEGGRIGYAEGTDKGPLYIDEDYDLDIPLTEYEKELREMSKEEREEELRILKSVLRQRGNIGRDLGIPGGGKTGKERQMELLTWGTDRPSEETGYEGDYSMRHRAAEYLDRPYFDEHYETGEHFNRGGRIGYATGGDYITRKPPRDMDMEWGGPEQIEWSSAREKGMDEDPLFASRIMKLEAEHEGDVAEYEGAALFDKAWDLVNRGIAENINHALQMLRGEIEPELPIGAAYGGRIRAQEGGLMNLGGMEKDYRQEGGFVPLGGEEKADDVPARLSKNEFVFTADAVRAAGGGDVDAGAKVMENIMENLEAGGEVSEESQGLEGARGMFANAQQLEKRII